MTGRLTWSLRWRLSCLWFLEWGITGTLMTYLPIYWEKINVPKIEQGQLMAVAAVGLWIAPFVVGQLVDRWIAAEKYLAFSHFLGGLALYWMATAAEAYGRGESNFQVLAGLCGLFAVAYFPTVPLTTALCFRHLPQPEAQFGRVRVWGTWGWMLSGAGLSLWLARDELLGWALGAYPETTFLPTLRTWIGWLPAPAPSDCFRMSALLSFALSSFCILLPHTPPLKAPQDSVRVAPLAVAAMFRDRSFTVFVAVAVLMAILVVPLFNLAAPNLVGRLLKERGFSNDWVPAAMLIGQISEFPALLLLPWSLRKFGMKFSFTLGIAAWAFRFALFTAALEASQWSAAYPARVEQTRFWLVTVGLSLHGVCHVFLIIVAQLYLDAKCRKDLRVSAQNLLSFLTLGIGMPLGSILGGVLYEYYHSSGHRRFLFLFPMLAACGLMFIFWKLVAPPEASGEPRLRNTHPPDEIR